MWAMLQSELCAMEITLEKYLCYCQGCRVTGGKTSIFPVIPPQQTFPFNNPFHPSILLQNCPTITYTMISITSDQTIDYPSNILACVNNLLNEYSFQGTAGEMRKWFEEQLDRLWDSWRKLDRDEKHQIFVLHLNNFIESTKNSAKRGNAQKFVNYIIKVNHSLLICSRQIAIPPCKVVNSDRRLLWNYFLNLLQSFHKALIILGVHFGTASCVYWNIQFANHSWLSTYNSVSDDSRTHPVPLPTIISTWLLLKISPTLPIPPAISVGNLLRQTVTTMLKHSNHYQLCLYLIRT